MAIDIDHIDHFVLTVASIEVTCDFYTRVLGMRVPRGRRSSRMARRSSSHSQRVIVTSLARDRRAISTSGSGPIDLRIVDLCTIPLKR